MSRAESLASARRLFNREQPPEGVRLEVATIAARLKVTISDLANASGISRTAVADLITRNKWPVKADGDHIRVAIGELLEARGATDDDLAQLWFAHVSATAPDYPRRALAPAEDKQGRALPRRPAHLPPINQEDTDMLLMKQTLTPEARRHFKLFRNPFDGNVTSDEMMFSGAEFDYVRESAWQCAKVGGFVAVVGESGAGKTTVLNDLRARLDRDAQKVLIIKPSVLGMELNDNDGKMVKSGDILTSIITALDEHHPVPQSPQRRTTCAGKLLTASVQAGNTHLLVVEESHSIPDTTLRHLKRLHEMGDGRKPLLGILLLAQPELKMRLASGLANGTLREVAQRIEIVELLPLDADLGAYLRCRAKACQVELDTLLQPQAVEQIRERLTRRSGGRAISMCYPLAVHNLVTKALNKAAELGMPAVTKELVSQV